MWTTSFIRLDQRRGGVRFLQVQARQQTFNKDLQLIEDSGFPSVVESNNDDLVLCETSKHRQSQQV